MSSGESSDPGDELNDQVDERYRSEGDEQPEDTRQQLRYLGGRENLNDLRESVIGLDASLNIRPDFGWEVQVGDGHLFFRYDFGEHDINCSSRQLFFGVRDIRRGYAVGRKVGMIHTDVFSCLPAGIPDHS